MRAKLISDGAKPPIIVVLGKRGSGKTTFVRDRLLYRLPKPVIIIDNLSEYGYSDVTIFDNLVVFTEWYKDGCIYNGRKLWCFRLTTDRQIDALFQMIWYINNCSVIVEEADMYCRPSWTMDSLDRLIRYGRHRGVSMVFVSRRAAEVGRGATAQADVIVSFRQTEPRDVQVLRQLGDIDGDVARLENFKHITLGALGGLAL